MCGGGQTVIAIYKSNDQKAQEAINEIGSKNFKVVKLDVTKESEVKTFFSSLKRLDFLVNCAGMSIEAPFEELPMKDVKKVMDVNLLEK